MSKDKVLFNLKNAHYAKHKVTGEDGTITFDTPVAIPGSVSLSLDAEGEVTKFYADGIVYYVCQSNNGYSGDFEVAMFPEQMMLDIWGMTKSKNGLIVENANVQPASFALLFEVDGDTTGRKYVLYNCSATRPGINANTKSETTDPDTQTSTITVSPMADGTIKAHTADDVTPATLNGWYTSVTLPTDAIQGLCAQ